MQMKKFEARTMKEALEMVKTQLGPDAVILSAKEVTKGFGLGGEKSIEITAAYSESVLQQKKFVEAKMPAHLKETFIKSSAKMQKQAMQKAIQPLIEKANAQAQAKAVSKFSLSTQVKDNAQSGYKPSTYKAASTQAGNGMQAKRRYADITDDDSQISSQYQIATQFQQKNANEFQLNQQNMFNKNNIRLNNHTNANANVQHEEVVELKSELEQLKTLISQFKSMPQNFVQPHPGAEYGVNYTLSRYYSFLTQKGILPEIASSLLLQAQQQIPLEKQNSKQVIEGYISKYILKTTNLIENRNSKFHYFVGPSGHGKTTSLVKFASYLSLIEKKRVALISTDTLKIGADEQMRIYAQILNLPYISIRSQADWFKVFPFLDQVDHVLVDFASVNLKQEDELNYLNQMKPSNNLLNQYDCSAQTHLVLSATAKDLDLYEVYRRYSQIQIDDVMFTSLDEAVLYGNIYNFISKTQLPLFGFGIGPKTPEDFELATAERMLDLIMNISQSQKVDISL